VLTGEKGFSAGSIILSTPPSPLASPQEARLQVRMSGLATQAALTAVAAGVLHSKGCDNERRFASVVVALAPRCLTIANRG
jgi:hypothetical protein